MSEQFYSSVALMRQYRFFTNINELLYFMKICNKCPANIGCSNRLGNHVNPHTYDEVSLWKITSLGNRCCPTTEQQELWEMKCMTECKKYDKCQLCAGDVNINCTHFEE
jgi:hypothetical protein